MTNKKKQRTRALAKKSGMTYSAAANALHDPSMQSTGAEAEGNTSTDVAIDISLLSSKSIEKWTKFDLETVQTFLEGSDSYRSWFEAVVANSGADFERMQTIYENPPKFKEWQRVTKPSLANLIQGVAFLQADYRRDRSPDCNEAALEKSFTFLVDLYLAEQRKGQVDWRPLHHTMECVAHYHPTLFARILLERGAPVRQFPLLDADPEVFALLAKHGAPRPSEKDIETKLAMEGRFPAKGLVEHYGFERSYIYTLIEWKGPRNKGFLPGERDGMARDRAYKALDYLLSDPREDLDLSWLADDLQLYAFRTLYEAVEAGPYLRAWALRNSSTFVVSKVLQYYISDGGDDFQKSDALLALWGFLEPREWRSILGTSDLDILIQRIRSQSVSSD